MFICLASHSVPKPDDEDSREEQQSHKNGYVSDEVGD